MGKRYRDEESIIKAIMKGGLIADVEKIKEYYVLNIEGRYLAKFSKKKDVIINAKEKGIRLIRFYDELGNLEYVEEL